MIIIDDNSVAGEDRSALMDICGPPEIRDAQSLCSGGSSFCSLAPAHMRPAHFQAHKDWVLIDPDASARLPQMQWYMIPPGILATSSLQNVAQAGMAVQDMSWADVLHCTLLVRGPSPDKWCDAKHLHIRDLKGHVGCSRNQIAVVGCKSNSPVPEAPLKRSDLSKEISTVLA
jgi:hypothetical protein